MSVPALIAPFPHLPLEIIEQIISQLWHSRLSIADRTKLTESSHLVSPTWSKLFSRIAFTDVYITSEASCCAYFRILCGMHPHLDGSYACARARSVTFEFQQPSFTEKSTATEPYASTSTITTVTKGISTTEIVSTVRPDVPVLIRDKEEAVQASAMGNFLVAAPFLLPSLHRLSIVYTNFQTNDMPLRLSDIPSQIDEIEVTYEYTQDTNREAVEAIWDSWKIESSAPHTLENVKRVSVRGGGEAAKEGLAMCCPNLEWLNGKKMDGSEPHHPETSSSAVDDLDV